MDDLISRQSAIDALIELSVQRDEWDSKEGFAQKRGIDAAICAIEDLPSAERRGRWERKGYHLHCSCCDWSADLATPHCPGCGAYLGGDV